MSAMPRLLTLPLATAAAAVLCSCASAPSPVPDKEPVTWQMTQQAEASYQFMQFETARRFGHHEKAEAALERLIASSPTPRVYLEGANYYWQRNMVGQARTMLKQGIEKFPGHRELSMTLATTYYAEKRFDAATVTIREYLKVHPEDKNALKELGVVLLGAKDYAGALDAIESIPEADRDASTLYYGSKASTGLGLVRQAIGMLFKATEMKPDFVEAWAEMAFLFEVERDYVSAEETYNRILELGETNGEVWLRLINLNLKMNNPDKALSLYKQGPDDTNFALEAATVFLDQKFYDHARTILAPLPKEGKNSSRIWFYLAVLAYEGEQNPDKAIDFLRHIPADDVHYERAIRFRAQLLVDAGRHDDALQLVRSAKAKHSDIRDYWLLEASIHEMHGKLQRALDTLQDALDNWPEDTELLYSLGIIQDKMGSRDRSVQTMERIISINPEHADALNFVGYTLADEHRDLDRAYLLISKALELDPESGFIIDSLAWLHFKKQEYEKAWKAIQRAVDYVADDPTIWEHYGDIAKAAGNLEKAREGYRNSLELKPGNAAVQKKLDEL